MLLIIAQFIVFPFSKYGSLVVCLAISLSRRRFPRLLRARCKMLNYSGLASYVEPIPIAPLFPDFALCSPAYGAGLRRQDGLYAGGILPQGTRLLDYSVIEDQEGGRAWAYELPFDVAFGGVWITVEVASPVSIDSIPLVPNDIRGMAAYLANSCVGARGSGGFVTHRVQGLVDYVTDPMADIDAPEYPASTAFITLTMSSPQHAHSFPGDYDPHMAEILQEAEHRAMEVEAEPLRLELADRAIRFRAQGQRMSRLGTVPWWDTTLIKGNKTGILNRPSHGQAGIGRSKTSRRSKRFQRFSQD